ncbi:MAG: ABC transporter ATP-binding protein [Pelagibacterium sp. SCN 64-44]|nr:MAG: ABC transporter ATP-binding protein [Pelagibacterium sp. SCN 64-44]
MKPPASPECDGPLLSVEELRVSFPTRNGLVKAVDGISFEVHPGRTLCVVGESGSGKSVTGKAILNILDAPGEIADGRVMLRRRNGKVMDLVRLGPKSREIREVRGAEVAMIFQEPMSSLSPVHTIGDQITESLILHLGMSKADARARCIELLTQVEIPRPETAIDQYSFEFSGGMRQRVMIAMALSCNPSVLIADEPTTALDVTTQAEVLDLIERLQVDYGMAVIFITHDMGVVAEIADDIIVMNRGVIVERGKPEAIFHNAQNDYTRMLVDSAMRLEEKSELRKAAQSEREARPAEPILTIKDLTKQYSAVKAVDGVSITLNRGESVGVVGESGSGKTTLGKCILRMIEPTSGAICYDVPGGGQVDLVKAGRKQLREVRRDIRMIFQDPMSSLNPRMTIAQSVGEPFLVNGLLSGKALDSAVAELLEMVGINPDWRERYPHAFSGGQRQRICIARAISLEPNIIVADEATAALDVSLRAQMLDLLISIQEKMGLSFLFISHDIGVIRYFCDRMVVMYRGRIVEQGDVDTVYHAPSHPYTQALLSAVLHPDPSRRGSVQRFRYNGEEEAKLAPQ